MRSPRRFATAMVAAAAVGAATIGVTAAVAQQDESPAGGADDTALLERLGDLEQQLEGGLADDLPEPDELSDEDWRDYADVFAGYKGGLAPVEDDLRSLFVDADDADGPAADAVSTVASGWLDLTNAVESFSVVASHDLEFPLATADDDGVATGADPLRGTWEHGATLMLQGFAKQLDGYTALRDLGAADAATQHLIDERAADAEAFDAELRPILAGQLSASSTTVLVPLGRFETKGPGVDARAASMSYVCVDRELLEAETRPLTDEVLVELETATPERADCVEDEEATVDD